METKRCRHCMVEQPLSHFNKDKSKEDGKASNCRKCTNKLRGVCSELTLKESSIFLKYFPHIHKDTGIIARKPDANTKEEAEPITLREMAADNNIDYFRLQSMFYKLIRLNLVSLIIQSDDFGGVQTLIYYKRANIIEYISELESDKHEGEEELICAN